MNAIDNQKRKDAVRGLINIVLLEGAVLMLVIGVYFYTSNIVHLVGGIIGSSLIFTPMLLRWIRAHGAAMKAKPNSVEQGDG